MGSQVGLPMALSVVRLRLGDPNLSTCGLNGEVTSGFISGVTIEVADDGTSGFTDG